MGKWADMYHAYARQKLEAEEQRRYDAEAKANVWGESGREYVTGFDPASPEGGRSAFYYMPGYAEHKRAQKAADYQNDYDFGPATITPSVYFDPVTGKQFTCDINLDKFKKSNSVWITLNNPVYQKYKKFLRIFDVQDAVIL